MSAQGMAIAASSWLDSRVASQIETVRGTPPTDSGAGASAKHSQAAFPAHVPMQSLLLPHGALLLHRAWVPH